MDRYEQYIWIVAGAVLINYHILNYNIYIIEYNYYMMHAMDLGRSDG